MMRLQPRSTANLAWINAARRCRYFCIVSLVVLVYSVLATFTVSVPWLKVYLLWGRLNVEWSSTPVFSYSMAAATGGFVMEPAFDGHVYSSWWFVRIPTWAIAGAGVLAVGVCELKLRMRDPLGRCTGCGYDLSGLAPARDRRVLCPECGRAGDEGTTNQR